MTRKPGLLSDTKVFQLAEILRSLRSGGSSSFLVELKPWFASMNELDDPKNRPQKRPQNRYQQFRRSLVIAIDLRSGIVQEGVHDVLRRLSQSA